VDPSGLPGQAPLAGLEVDRQGRIEANACMTGVSHAKPRADDPVLCALMEAFRRK
jgi:hypothetical protein